MKVLYPRAAALAVGESLLKVLAGPCVEGRLLIVGSVRREKPDVSDVEILYIGRQVQVKDPESLFPELKVINLAEVMIESLRHARTLKYRFNVTGGISWGSQIKLGRHGPSEIPVDLFAATEENWWNLLVCRTGPAASNLRICQTAERQGLKWEPYGPGLVDRETGKVVWRAQDEEGVFRELGLPYYPPEKRR